MLHAKFQDHRASGSGEEDFLRFLPYLGMAASFLPLNDCATVSPFKRSGDLVAK